MNWLLYDVGERFLRKYAPHFKGALYDLGCGEQSHRPFFLRYANQYIGVEWSGGDDSLRPDIVADLNRPLAIADGVADTVVSLSVLEHLYEPQCMLNEAFRILKPGGAMVLQVPWQWWIHEAPHDYFRFTPYGLRYMLNKAGFQVVHIEAQCGFFTTWIVKFNYFSNRAITGPRYFRRFLKTFLVPFWYLGQVFAPFLDKLDKDWDLEAQGYFVLAIKSDVNESEG
jgi:SAM-dependent methyltransferase